MMKKEREKEEGGKGMRKREGRADLLTCAPSCLQLTHNV